jgi:glycosyltransferase involved in cell wall biosynthesis
MRYAWDQEHAYFPNRHGPVARLRNLILTRLRTWDAASAGRVDLFVANSSFVAQRIGRYYGREAEVLHPPVDTDFFTPGEGAEGRYCLMVAALAPYKRVDLGIAACERLGLELRVVGDGPDRQRLARQGGGRTRLLGRVDDDTLRSLYRGALCFLQPGVEDFGISSVEALACGCPVVALGRGGVLDIVGDGEHGILYTEENDPEALATAIDKSGKIGFNELNLNQRAAEFATARFGQRLQSMLSSRLRNPIGSWGGEIQS